MIYPKETWDRKTQAMGQFFRRNHTDGVYTLSFTLEEKITASENYYPNGGYASHFYFVPHKHVYINLLRS